MKELDFIPDVYEIRSMDLAEYIFKESARYKLSMSAGKLHKIMYLVCGIFLAEYGKKLVDEDPIPTPSGPEFRLVAFKEYILSDWQDSLEYRRSYAEIPLLDTTYSSDVYRIVHHVLQNFGHRDLGYLTNLLTLEDPVWNKITNKGKAGFSWIKRMSQSYNNMDIKKHFEQLIKTDKRYDCARAESGKGE